MEDAKEVVIKFLVRNLKLKEEEIEKHIEIPPSSELGDYAFPCYILSPILKKNPIDISQDLAFKLQINKNKPKEIIKVEANGAYINFFISKNYLVAGILDKILKEKEKYGNEKKKKGNVALEHTSLNPNSSPHVGRARNSIIGDSLKRILEFKGYKVETYYYVNDVSKQIAIMALDFKGNETFDKLLNLYVKTNKRLGKNPELEKKVFDLLEKFEKGDKKIKAKFKKIVNIAITGQKKILKEFGIEFDKFDYESSYIKDEKNILDKLNKTKKLFKDEQGRLVLNQEGHELEGKMKNTVLVLARSNGTGLYPLRDISYNIDKLKRCKKTYIVLGEDQKLYFEQLKVALKMIGEKSPEVIHYSYVLIEDKGKASKMSTRKGDVVLLEDFMKEAREKAAREIKIRKTKGDAKKIGYGAVKYAIIRNDPNKNIIFNWEQALSFEGNSGPYLQYSYARASSIFKKAKQKINKKINFDNLDLKEIELVKKLGEFPNAVNQAYAQLNPALIANYSFELAQVFNEFYHVCKVLEAEKSDKDKRIALVEAFRIVIKSSLSLLGIEVMDEM